MEMKRISNRASVTMNPTRVDALILVANTARRYTIPEGTDKMLIGSISNILVLFGDSTVTAAFPVADALDGSAPFLDPGMIDVPADVTHVSIISDASARVYIATWKKGAM